MPQSQRQQQQHQQQQQQQQHCCGAAAANDSGAEDALGSFPAVATNICGVSSSSLSSLTGYGNGAIDHKPDERDADAELVLSVVFLGANHKQKLFEKLLESAERYERHIRYRDTFYLYYRFNHNATSAANNDAESITVDERFVGNRNTNPPPLPSSVVIELSDPGLEHTGAREMAIRKADAVILTYAAHDAVTFHQLASLVDDFQARASRDGRLYPPTVLMCNEDVDVADESDGEVESNTDDDCSSTLSALTIPIAEEPPESGAKPSESVTPEDGYASEERSDIAPGLSGLFGPRRRRCRQRHCRYRRNCAQPTLAGGAAVTSCPSAATTGAVTAEQGEHMARLFGAECRHFSASFARFDAARPMMRRLVGQVMATRQMSRRGGKKNDHRHTADSTDATATRKKAGRRSPPKLSSLRLAGRRRRASNSADDSSVATSPPHPPSAASSAFSSSYAFRILPPLRSINERFGQRRSMRLDEATKNASKSNGRREDLNSSATFGTTESTNFLGLPPTVEAHRNASELTDKSPNGTQNVYDFGQARQTLTIRVTADDETAGLHLPHPALHQQYSHPPPYRNHSQLCVAETLLPQRSRSANTLMPGAARHRSVSPRVSNKNADNRHCGRARTPRGRVTAAASRPLLLLSASPERALVRVRSAQRLASEKSGAATTPPPRRPRSSCGISDRTPLARGRNDNLCAPAAPTPTLDQCVHIAARGDDSLEDRKSDTDKAHWFKRLSNHGIAPHHKDGNATAATGAEVVGESTASGVCVIS